MQTIMYRVDKQQGPTSVLFRELYLISYDKPLWKRICKRIYISVTESLCCPAEGSVLSEFSIMTRPSWALHTQQGSYLL